jgi:hypothetical protein
MDSSVRDTSNCTRYARITQVPIPRHETEVILCRRGMRRNFHWYGYLPRVDLVDKLGHWRGDKSEKVFF